jgi:hypothetical protein
VDGVCICKALYEGEDCSIKWINDPTWRTCYNIYSAMAGFLQFFLLVIAIYQLYLQIYYTRIKNTSMWNIVTYFFITLIITSLSNFLIYFLNLTLYYSEDCICG